MKRNIIILIICIVLIIILSGLNIISPKIKEKIELKNIKNENQATLEKITETDIIKKEKILREKAPRTKINRKLPEKAYLEVKFICQAPLETKANWEFHEESCEEAALLMAYLYETKKTMTKEEANTEILKMIEWQKENFGAHKDMYADKLKEFTNKFYKIDENKIQVTKNASIKDIKRAISTGHPVIVPITGELLKNPYYPYPGYHMLLVIGYTEDKIITNDNGTKRGKDFSYNTDKFEKAMKDSGGDIMTLSL